jgi:hypothetical protein
MVQGQPEQKVSEDPPPSQPISQVWWYWLGVPATEEAIGRVITI